MSWGSLPRHHRWKVSITHLTRHWTHKAAMAFSVAVATQDPATEMAVLKIAAAPPSVPPGDNMLPEGPAVK